VNTRILTRDDWWAWLRASPPLRNERGAWTKVSETAWVLETDSQGTQMDSRLVLSNAVDPADSVVVVPYYSVGRVLSADESRSEGEALGGPLLDRGFHVLAVPWWAEVEASALGSRAIDLQERYGPPAERGRQQASSLGLGRAVVDIMRVINSLDALLPGKRVHIMGHSLGAKLALWTAALDLRISSLVMHEPGLGWQFSNWDAPWYLDGRIPDVDLDSLLALVAPRPALYVGGGGFDGDANAELARSAVRMSGYSDWLSTLHHNAGHRMPPHVVAACVEWLADREREVSR